MHPAAKLLALTEYLVTAANTQPMVSHCEGGLQVLAPAFSLVMALLMGLAFKDYDPVKQTVSQMVHYPYGWLLTTDFVVVSLWLVLMAVKFYFTYARRQLSKISGALLMFAAFGFLLIALFPTNMEGAVRNAPAVVHEYAARTVSVLFPVACALLLPQLFAEKKQRGLAIYTAVTAVIGIVLVIICAAVIYRDGETLGLFERLLMANALLWGLVAGVRLFPVVHSSTSPARMTR